MKQNRILQLRDMRILTLESHFLTAIIGFNFLYAFYLAFMMAFYMLFIHAYLFQFLYDRTFLYLIISSTGIFKI